MELILADRKTNFNSAIQKTTPFKHFVVPQIFEAELSDDLLKWFESDAPWRYHEEKDFYEAYHVNLTEKNLPGNLTCLIDPEFVASLRGETARLFDVSFDEAVDISAHRMSPGFLAKVHTDFGSQPFTHRLLVQVNRGWSQDNGGILMFLDSESPEEITDSQEFYIPRHGVGIGFEISAKSFHAISPIAYGERYTLKYSFRAN
jgi:Rps23 Pro-64 3,4-dihydroxylase Tpa1-like proline 4-hydroxylase